MPDQPEAFSRVLIDQALKESDWDLLDPQRVRFESSGRDGRADYILLGKNGPLYVLEGDSNIGCSRQERLWHSTCTEFWL